MPTSNESKSQILARRANMLQLFSVIQLFIGIILIRLHFYNAAYFSIDTLLIGVLMIATAIMSHIEYAVLMQLAVREELREYLDRRFNDVTARCEDLTSKMATANTSPTASTS